MRNFNLTSTKQKMSIFISAYRNNFFYQNRDHQVKFVNEECDDGTACKLTVVNGECPAPIPQRGIVKINKGIWLKRARKYHKPGDHHRMPGGAGFGVPKLAGGGRKEDMSDFPPFFIKALELMKEEELANSSGGKKNSTSSEESRERHEYSMKLS